MITYGFKHCFVTPWERVPDGFLEDMKGTIVGEDVELHDVTIGYDPQMESEGQRAICVEGILHSENQLHTHEISDVSWAVFSNHAFDTWAGVAKDMEWIGGDVGMPKGLPDVKKALDIINRHRRSMGRAPLDPSAAGWTREDILIELDRLKKERLVANRRREPRKANRRLVNKLKRSLLR